MARPFERLPRAEPSAAVEEQAPCIAGAADVLTAREHQVASLLIRGLHNADVARRLGISVFTVGKHIENIYTKLGIHSRHELARHAQRLGIV